MLAAFRMLFLREFAAAEMGDSEPNGSGVASDKAIPAKSGEAFVPTYVYEAMRENKRFDTMRVSQSSMSSCIALANGMSRPS
jgi:hypothetical protein